MLWHHFFLFVLVDGGWSSWALYGSCSNGLMTYNRACDSPSPLNGGNECLGPEEKDTVCPIDGNWGPWYYIGGCENEVQTSMPKVLLIYYTVSFRVMECFLFCCNLDLATKFNELYLSYYNDSVAIICLLYKSLIFHQAHLKGNFI